MVRKFTETKIINDSIRNAIYMSVKEILKNEQRMSVTRDLRMPRNHKTEISIKQVITTCAVLNKPLAEINQILKRYGYCLSNSIAAYAVIK